MSADNGIYILKTKDEFRVAYATAIDNLDWYQRFEPDKLDLYLASVWGHSTVFQNKVDALVMADCLASEYSILEYGISTIELDMDFPNISHADAYNQLYEHEQYE